MKLIKIERNPDGYGDDFYAEDENGGIWKFRGCYPKDEHYENENSSIVQIETTQVKWEIEEEK